MRRTRPMEAEGRPSGLNAKPLGLNSLRSDSLSCISHFTGSAAYARSRTHHQLRGRSRAVLVDGPNHDRQIRADGI